MYMYKQTKRERKKVRGQSTFSTLLYSNNSAKLKLPSYSIYLPIYLSIYLSESSSHQTNTTTQHNQPTHRNNTVPALGLRERIRITKNEKRVRTTILCSVCIRRPSALCSVRPVLTSEPQNSESGHTDHWHTTAQRSAYLTQLNSTQRSGFSELRETPL